MSHPKRGAYLKTGEFCRRFTDGFNHSVGMPENMLLCKDNEKLQQSMQRVHSNIEPRITVNVFIPSKSKPYLNAAVVILLLCLRAVSV